jgi:glutamate 5-kinase
MAQQTKRIVIKIGTTSITTTDGLIDNAQMQNIVEQIATLHREGQEIILITSGAVGTGKTITQLSHTNDETAQKQVLAAVGQAALIATYQTLFAKYDIVPAQILVTKEDFRDTLHTTNMQRCFEALLQENIVPIVNENDTTAIEELMFTDNDELTMLVALLVHATEVVMLTSVDGVLINGATVEGINKTTIDTMIESITDSTSHGGRGGMKNKLRYAKILMDHNIPVAIANARTPRVICDVISQKIVGTRIQ